MAYNLNPVDNIFKTIDIAGRQSNLQNYICQKLKANYDHVLWDKLNDYLILTDHICSWQSDIAGFPTKQFSDPHKKASDQDIYFHVLLLFKQ